jgi:hypothetical protein
MVCLGFEDDDGFRVFFLICHVMMSSTCWNWRNKGGDVQELYSKTISSFVVEYACNYIQNLSYFQYLGLYISSIRHSSNNW